MRVKKVDVSVSEPITEGLENPDPERIPTD
jgi:hypothetical protein